MKLLVTVLLVILCGCGGGSVANAPPSAPVAPTVTPPPAIPSSWVATDLPPLPGYNAAQANALNAAGHAVGYSLNLTGNAEAELWINGIATDLGPGVAKAINDSDQIVGYDSDANGNLTAHLWQSGTRTDLGSWLPTGINNSGLIVGVDTAGTSAFKWTAAGGLQPVLGCSAALGVNNSGQISGISDGNAAVCGVNAWGPGAAVSINDAGVAAGYSENPTDAMLWPATDIASSGLAVGINEYGWVVGEQILEPAVAVRARVVGRPDLAGSSHPFIWSQQTGIIMLSGAVTVSGINRSGQVSGAAAVGEEIHGVLLTGN